jgi:predicted nucleotide-binding protein (sugar kinase/HSP70/actin superfamily)
METNKLENVFLYRFDFQTQFLGIKLMDVIRYFPPGFILGDIIHEIESALQVVGEENSLELLYQYWGEFLSELNDKNDFHKNVKKLCKKIAKIPRKANPKDLPKVLISGDFFVRFSPFFLRELKEMYAKEGILIKSTDLFELGIYGNHFNGGYIITKEWKKDPDKLTTALRATATPWDKGSQIFLLSRAAIRFLLRMEKKLRKEFEKTGLLFAQPNDLRKILKLSSEWISRLIFGEAIPTIGKGLETLEDSHFDSLILTGPFNCLPYKISQAILKPIYLEHGVPFLVFDADISSMTPNEKRLIHANIEQIKRKSKVAENNSATNKTNRRKNRWFNKLVGKRKRLIRRTEKKKQRWETKQKNS